jgi:hypothetical protein
MVLIELGRLGFHVGFTGPILKADWSLYALTNATAAAKAMIALTSN